MLHGPKIVKIRPKLPKITPKTPKPSLGFRSLDLPLVEQVADQDVGEIDINVCR